MQRLRKEKRSQIRCEMICQRMHAIFEFHTLSFFFLFFLVSVSVSLPLVSFTISLSDLHKPKQTLSAKERFQTRLTDKRGIPTLWIIWHTYTPSHLPLPLPPSLSHTHKHRESQVSPWHKVQLRWKAHVKTICHTLSSVKIYVCVSFIFWKDKGKMFDL